MCRLEIKIWYEDNFKDFSYEKKGVLRDCVYLVLI